jgi:nitrite reductase/ring-hydroxylating ferredoxin subunit
MPEVNIGPASDFDDPGRKIIGFERFEVAVFKLDGEFFAYLNHCPHQGGPACQGKIIAKVDEIIADDRTSKGMAFSKTRMHVVCPWHGFEFDIRTGVHPGNARARLRKMKVAVAGGDVIVTVPEAREAVPVMAEANIAAAP